MGYFLYSVIAQLSSRENSLRTTFGRALLFRAHAFSATPKRLRSRSRACERQRRVARALASICVISGFFQVHPRSAPGLRSRFAQSSAKTPSVPLCHFPPTKTRKVVAHASTSFTLCSGIGCS